MPHTTKPGPKIYFETTGSRNAEPLVLIEGLSAHLLGWRDEFVQQLTDQGLFVIRLDNRDVGLSEKVGGPDDLVASYSVDDMARDVIAVLDELDIRSAHIVGQSMGGVITQALALEHASRLRSMVLFYTLPAFGPPFLTADALAMIETSSVTLLPREEAIATRVESERLLAGSRDYSFDEVWIRKLTEMCYDRCYRPDGVARQASALAKSGDRRGALTSVQIPTAIIHGRADRLVQTESALALAAAIPDSELHLYPGMGHAVVMGLWAEFVAIIARTVRRGLSKL